MENSKELEDAYVTVATRGSSIPSNVEELGNHYLCFVKSSKNGHLYQVSSTANGPANKGKILDDEDVLGPTGVGLVQKLLSSAGEGSGHFSLIALVQATE